jgi:hypothetical protein
MMRHPLYLIYSLSVIGFMSIAQSSGWTLSGLNQARTTPHTVRDNPGAFRPSYNDSPRYSGGK